MSTPILFVIVGKNEPLFEAEIDTTGASGGNDLSTRQNYFVLHSSLDLVEKSSWTTNNMYLRVVDKVRRCVESVNRNWVSGIKRCVYVSLLTQHQQQPNLLSKLYTGKSSASINIFNCRECKVHAPSWRQGGRSDQEFFQWGVRLFCQAVNESILQIWHSNIVESIWCKSACCCSSISILATPQYTRGSKMREITDRNTILIRLNNSKML